jgi:4-amino-4-deoxy-L-arabinose transferase-like glycosyltransferase
VQTVFHKSSFPFFGGLILFFCAIVFYYFSVLNIDYRKSSHLNLRPGPDATEYFAQAKAMLKGEKPSIRIGYERLPSAFPPGYSALMLPWLKILPQRDSILAPFRTNQTIGLLLLSLVFGFYLYLSMPVAGGVAALLLATLPGFFTFCRSSLSDTSAWFLYALAFMFAYLGLKEERRWKIYLSAFFLGLSMNLRLQSVFFASLLIAMPLMPIRKQFWRWFFHCAVAGLVFLVAASPFLILNTIEFGSPLKIGGNFWYPSRHLFSPANVFTGNIALFCTEFAMRPHAFFAANVFGTGTVFVPAIVLLICLGFFFLRFNRVVICFLVTDLAFLVATVSYLYPDGRYYLQLLIVLIPVAVLAVVWAINNLSSHKRIAASLGILVLFVASCLGYPSRSGYNGNYTNRSQTWDALNYHKGHRKPFWYDAEEEFVRLYGNRPGVILSDIDPVYLNALLPDHFAAAPIDETHLRQWSPFWHYGRPQATALVSQALARSVPVYALFVSRKDVTAQAERLPKIRGYQWSEAHAGGDDVVLKLLPLQTGAAGLP